ncbi:MAG TPA: hypothetical protein VIN08_18720 [Ohtaekwangia sp.]|uniref:hypothetical protein n=1 Tax=Ohtaekwangia sp. TaxID=2066019 RepID=UPI002F934618
MNTKNIGLATRWKSLTLLALLSCSSDLSDDAIPYQPFQDIVINLNLPEYNTLKTTGHQNIKGGVRGIILHRVNATSYRAFERNCSYQPANACATVEIHASGLYMTDPCCGSNFDFNGAPMGGAAWRPLQQYATTLTGSDLRISSDIVQ